MLKKTTRKILALALASAALLSLAALPAAAQDWTKVPQVTVDIPGTVGLQITFTNVASLYSDSGYNLEDMPEGDIDSPRIPYGAKTAWRGIDFYLYEDATVSFNKPVEILFKTSPDFKEIVRTINVGEILPASEFAGEEYLWLGHGVNLALLDTSSADKYDFSNGSDFFNILFSSADSLKTNWINSRCNQLSQIVAKTLMVTAKSSEDTTFMLNSTEVSLPAYNIADNNYVKLRDVASLLGNRFDVRWEDNKAKLYDHADYKPVGGELAEITGSSQTAAPSETDFVWGDTGEAVSGLTAYLINNNNYIKLRDIAQLFDFDVDWRDGKAWIEPDEAYTPD
jgi:hypothetical protein